MAAEAAFDPSVAAFPLLTAMILVPAVGAVLTLLLPARRPEDLRLGYVTSAAVFGLAVYLLIQFDTDPVRGAGYQFVSNHQWMPAVGIRWTVGIDGISLFMVALTALLIPISLLASADLEKPVVHVLGADARGVGDRCVHRSTRIVFFVFFGSSRSCRCTSSSRAGATATAATRP